MSEYLKTEYKALFQLNIFHHYWLDSGATLFDDTPVDTSVMNFQGHPLRNYDARQFLSVLPTASTAKKFADKGLIFKATTLGFVVAMPVEAVLPLDEQFEFVLTVKDASFFDYTSLTLPAQKIYELTHPIDGKFYRYKENVMVLSNATGTSRTVGATQSLYLSSPPQLLVGNEKAESIFVTLDDFLRQLDGDAPSFSTQITSHKASELPVFVHQGDVPTITPPLGLVGAPARGVLLNEDVPDNVFALIRLNATRPSNDAFSFVDAQGKLKPAAPVYQVRFKNRSTVRRYFDRSSGVFKEEVGPLAMTYFGNAGVKQKPVTAPKLKLIGNRVVRLESEIFV